MKHGKCEECKVNEAACGLGVPPRWLCFDCFDKAIGAGLEAMLKGRKAASDVRGQETS